MAFSAKNGLPSLEARPSGITSTITGPRRSTCKQEKTARPAAPCASYCYHAFSSSIGSVSSLKLSSTLLHETTPHFSHCNDGFRCRIKNVALSSHTGQRNNLGFNNNIMPRTAPARQTGISIANPTSLAVAANGRKSGAAKLRSSNANPINPTLQT